MSGGLAVLLDWVGAGRGVRRPLGLLASALSGVQTEAGCLHHPHGAGCQEGLTGLGLHISQCTERHVMGLKTASHVLEEPEAHGKQSPCLPAFLGGKKWCHAPSYPPSGVPSPCSLWGPHPIVPWGPHPHAPMGPPSPCSQWDPILSSQWGPIPVLPVGPPSYTPMGPPSPCSQGGPHPILPWGPHPHAPSGVPSPFPQQAPSLCCCMGQVEGHVHPQASEWADGTEPPRLARGFLRSPQRGLVCARECCSLDLAPKGQTGLSLRYRPPT